MSMTCSVFPTVCHERSETSPCTAWCISHLGVEFFYYVSPSFEWWSVIFNVINELQPIFFLLCPRTISADNMSNQSTSTQFPLHLQWIPCGEMKRKRFKAALINIFMLTIDQNTLTPSLQSFQPLIAHGFGFVEHSQLKKFQIWCKFYSNFSKMVQRIREGSLISIHSGCVNELIGSLLLGRQ